MNKDAREQLLQVIGSTASATMENRHSLMAILEALKERHPEVYEAYQKNLAAVQRQDRDQTQIAIALEHLQTLLQK